MSYWGWLKDKLGNDYGTETNPLLVGFGDSASLDAFSRLRVGNPVNIFENKNIHDRTPSQWEEPIVGAIIVHGAVTGGPFQVAETITGGTSDSVGTVTAVDGGSLTVTYTINHNDIVDGETITGGTSGATASVTTHNTGSHISHDRNTAAVILQVGALSGDSAVRQTHRYFSYVPGKSHEIWMTFVFGTAVANVRRRSGYFDTDNGIFLQQTSSGISIVHRSKTSGSVVDTEIAQDDWNIDVLDGSGKSGITLDFTKSKFLVIDMQWQGDGRVRAGVFHNGRIVYAHAFEFSETISTAYMSTPSLPVRHEIANTAATAGVNTMDEICTAVVSIGGERPSGLGYTVSNDVTPRTINNGAESPVIAVRLKAVHPNGGANRVTAELSNMSFFPTGSAAHFEIFHVHEPSSITGTWNDVGHGSACEYSTDISAITAPLSHAIEEGYAGAGAAGKGGSENDISGDKLDQHRFLSQNFDSTNSEIFVIYGEAITGNAEAYSHISWIEFD